MSSTSTEPPFSLGTFSTQARRPVISYAHVWPVPGGTRACTWENVVDQDDGSTGWHSTHRGRSGSGREWMHACPKSAGDATAADGPNTGGEPDRTRRPNT